MSNKSTASLSPRKGARATRIATAISLLASSLIFLAPAASAQVADPAISVSKTASPTSRPAPGGDFTFSVQVTNTGNVPVTIVSLIDNIYGNLATRPGSNCGNLIGDVVLPNGPSPTCTFTGTFTGVAGEEETNTVTATADPGEGRDPVTATDTATVAITAADDPEITVQKTASPTSRPEPGGTFTFNVEVANTGNVPVSVQSVTDDTHTVGSDCDNLLGNLAVGESESCSFTGTFTGVAGDSETNTVTVTAQTPDQGTVSDTDTATVTITADDDDDPAVRVEKAVAPSSRPEPGGVFRFGIRVTNLGDDDAKVLGLVDSVYGNLNNRGSCKGIVGTELEPGENVTCFFDITFKGKNGDKEANTVKVVVREDDGDTASDTDSAEIRITAKSTDPGGDDDFDDKDFDDDKDETTIVVNNNSSSSSSSSAAAGGGGGGGAAPTNQLLVTELVRTGQDSVPMGAAAASLLVLGSLLVATAERERRRRRSF